MGFYRALLRLYPLSFRNEYGEEMAAYFNRQRLDTRGPLDRTQFLIRTVIDMLTSALRVHADILVQDLRFAIRSLARTPAFTLTAILVAALGIGANTAAFSVTDFVLLRPLDYPQADRLVAFSERSPGYPRLELSPSNYRDWRAQATSFTSVGAGWSVAANLVVRGAEPQRLAGAAITWDLLPTLGVPPAMGRFFTEAEDREGVAGTIVISDALWHTLFGSRPDVLGQQLTLDDQAYTVVGVMPATFAYPSRQAQFWRPIQFPGNETDRTNTYLRAIGRLKPGATVASARTELEAIAGRLAVQFPKEDGEISATAVALRDEVPRQSRMLTLALSGAAFCVLLIVCANQANLLLTRALARRKELAVRAAIGAGRERLIRQLATETAVLAILGGVLGIVIAYLAVPALAQLAPVSLPTAAAPQVNPRVLLFAAVLTFLTAAAFGVAPALRLGRDVDVNGLRESARSGARRDRLRSALVIAEVAVSIVLLVGVGLLLQALWTVGRVDPGFQTENVLTLRTSLQWPKYAPTEKRAAFYTRVLEDVRAVPGVTSAAYISGLPMVVRGGIWSIGVQGDPVSVRDSQSASLRYVSPDFFKTLGIHIRAGRDVSDADRQNSPYVAVVSESLARRHWPGENPIGKRFTVAFFERTIVGVVSDIRARGLEIPSEPQIYIPYRQIPDGYMSTFAPKDLAVRLSLPPERVVPSLRAIIGRADPQEPISDVRMLSEIVSQETSSRQAQLRVVGAFALIAMLLAAVGIHGLLAFGVSQRVQEFGVRMAIGAEPSRIALMVLKQAALLAAAGAVPGLLLAYAAGRSLDALLAGVSPHDPLTYAVAGGLVMAMVVVGSTVPAFRAFKVSPLEALRTEV